jgi:hypothetical protein
MDCVFANYEGRTQVGCDLGKIDAFRAADAEIIEATDNERDFYVINKRYCISHRFKNWGELHPRNKWKELVREEVRVPFHVIVLGNDSFEDVANTCTSFYYQTLRPNKITIINQKYISPERLSKVFTTTLTDITWMVQNPILGMDLTGYQCLDLILDHHYKFPFYVVANAGFMPDKNVLEDIDNFVNDDLRIFAMMESDDMVVIPTQVHKAMGGSRGNTTILEKIKAEEECQNQIYPLEEISQHFHLSTSSRMTPIES